MRPCVRFRPRAAAWRISRFDQRNRGPSHRLFLHGSAMKVSKDIETRRADWSFTGSVAETVVSHVRQSVPYYDAGHDLICDFSDYFCHGDSICYEIGVSTGELLRKLAQYHAHK